MSKIWNENIVWVEVLTISTYLKLFFSRYKTHRVVYFNSNVFYSYVSSITQLLFPLNITQLNNFSEGDHKLNGKSVYESIQSRVVVYLKGSIQEEDLSFLNETFKYNREKFLEHLRELSYSLIFRKIEMLTISELNSMENSFVFTKNLLSEKFITDHKLINHVVFSNSVRTFVPRKNYIYDQKLKKQSVAIGIKSLIRVIVEIVLNILISPFAIGYTENKTKKFCLELSQSNLELDSINDLYLLEKNINEQTVGLNLANLSLEEVQKIENEYKIQIYNVFLPDNLRNVTAYKKYSRTIIPNHRYFYESLKYFNLYFLSFFRSSQENWIYFGKYDYLRRTFYWQSIYSKLNSNISWTMFDIDPNKLPKSQAMELCNGFLVGGHWSNYPMMGFDFQKCVDVLFTWGPHFIKNNFNHFRFEAIFQVGYYLDYYFKILNQKPLFMKEQDFIYIGYVDNILSNDIAYSYKMDNEVYNLFIDLLENYSNVILVLKPKKSEDIESLVLRNPGMKKFFNNNRIKVLVSDNSKEKIAPTQVAFVSDLVIGLGISTAALECYFAGTPSFHVDLTGFYSNQFANNLDSKYVFRSIDALKLQVVKFILGQERPLKNDEIDSFFRQLDPFQDGRSRERIRLAIEAIRHALDSCQNRDEALRSFKAQLAKQGLVLV